MRPHVILTATMSLDGRIALGRDRVLLDPETGRRWADLHPPSVGRVRRPVGDAVLEGSGTFVPEGEVPTRLPATADRQPFDHLSAAADPAHESWFAVVDGRGRVRWTQRGDGGTDLLVLVADRTPREYLAFLQREGISYITAGKDRVDLPLALQRLHDELGVRTLVADGGGTLNAALFAAGLVDELDVLVLPAIVGGRNTPSLVDGPGRATVRLELRSVDAEDDGLVRLRYGVAVTV